VRRCVLKLRGGGNFIGGCFILLLKIDNNFEIDDLVSERLLSN